MERYFEISSLADAKEDEEVCALYPDPNNNVSGRKTEEKMIKAEEDYKQGKCRLWVWRDDKLGLGYLLTPWDIEQIKIEYENAKMIARESLRQNDMLVCIREGGKAAALESVLRMIGFDYTEVALEGDKYGFNIK